MGLEDERKEAKWYSAFWFWLVMPLMIEKAFQAVFRSEREIEFTLAFEVPVKYAATSQTVGYSYLQI